MGAICFFFPTLYSPCKQAYLYVHFIFLPCITFHTFTSILYIPLFSRGHYNFHKYFIILNRSILKNAAISTVFRQKNSFSPFFHPLICDIITTVRCSPCQNFLVATEAQKKVLAGAEGFQKKYTLLYPI